MVDKEPIKFSSNSRYKENVILRLSFEFAIKIVEFSKILEVNRKFVLAKQLVRSGTPIGTNVKEAQNAESRADFVHKTKIALKEADETEYWLFLCDAIHSYPDCQEMINELFSIIKLLNKIISSNKKIIKN